MSTEEADIMQELEYFAYACDGESTSYFERVLSGSTISRPSPPQHSQPFSWNATWASTPGFSWYARQRWISDAELPGAATAWQTWKKKHPKDLERRAQLIALQNALPPWTPRQ